MHRSSPKRSHHHLKQLLEGVIAEDFKLRMRGLAFFVDEIEVEGRPPERIRAWATLHFLQLGSPYCCSEPLCHLPLFGERLDRLDDAIRRQMGLQQKISVELVAIRPAPAADVRFDNLFTAHSPCSIPRDIDQKDGLGRTALMRAAVRGHDREVEELLKAGADPSATDNQGRSILEQLPTGRVWIIAMLEGAIGRSDSRK